MIRRFIYGDKVFENPKELARFIAEGESVKEIREALKEACDEITDNSPLFYSVPLFDMIQRNTEVFEIVKHNYIEERANDLLFEVEDIAFCGEIEGDYISYFGYDFLVETEDELTDEEEACLIDSAEDGIILDEDAN